MKEIIEVEEKFKKLLIEKLSGDKRLSLSCPDFEYPAPLFVYIKSVATEKSIAVRLDGGDKTMRFWDYVDDDYSEEDGVWENMTDDGLEKFVQKLYNVMQNAVDVEFFDAEGECNDYFSGVAKVDLTAENALRAVKKLGKNKDFVIVKISNFFGDKQFAFDRAFRQRKIN